MTDYGSMINRPHFTTGGGGDGELPPDPAVPTQVLVNLDTLVAFAGNPRKSRNPNYDEIKESIRKIGLENPPKVTRADPSHPYMIRDGGNTRLQILNELWAETQDRRFYEFKCIFHPYSDELDMIIKHCIENEMRGGMLLIERGLAALSVKNTLELKTERKLSATSLAWELKERGWVVNDKSLSFALYAAENLIQVIPTTLWAGLGRDQIQRLKKIIGDCETYWSALEDNKDLPEEAKEEFTLIWQEALRAADSEDLTVDRARDAIEGAMADYLGCPVMTLRGDIQAMSEGVSRGGSVPKSVLTGTLPDLTVKPQSAQSNQSTQAATGGQADQSRQEAARTSNQDAAKPTQKAAPTKNQETAGVTPGAAVTEKQSGAGDGTHLQGAPLEGDNDRGGLEQFENGSADSEFDAGGFDLSPQQIQLEIFHAAAQLAHMHGFAELVVPGDQLAPGTDHFGYLMLAPTPAARAMFISECADNHNIAPSATYRQLLNMSAACKFAFPNSPEISFFSHLAYGRGEEDCVMRMQDDSWLAMLRILPESEQLHLIRRIEQLSLVLLQTLQHIRNA